MPRRITMREQLARFPVVVNRQTPQTPVGLHTHEFTELVIIVGGRGVHFSGQETYEIMAGDAFVVTGAHGYKDTEQLNLVNILFHPRRLALPLAEARKLPGYHAFFALEPQYRRYHRFKSCLHLGLDQLSRVSGLLNEMEKELAERRPGFEFLVTALLMQLIGFLSRAYARMRAPSSRPLLRLGAVLSYLESHYTEPVRVEALAGIAHMSQSGLLRAFRSATGHAPIEYLIRLKLLRACELLRVGEFNITETALRTGFNDSNYFTRQFRRVFGITPREFARQARAGG